MANIFWFLVVLVLLSAVASAATCAEKSYAASCAKCSFDSSGKMNQACYQDYQNRGVQCLFAAYPLESIEYQAGNCPAIQACIDRLQTCKALYSSGNDQEDCGVESINHCFVRGDACVADAVTHCSTPSPDSVADVAPPSGWCDGFFFMIIPLLAGVAIFRMKAG